MAAELPSPEMLWLAIDLYLREAYDGSPKRDVMGRLESLRQEPPAALHQSRVIERDPTAPAGRYRLRLGNRAYPHMKLQWDASPDGARYLFKCDTHDRHCCPPPASPEYAGFLRLMRDNEEVARRVEAAWDAAGVATFKQYLRDDLDRRRAAAAAAGTTGPGNT